MHLVETPIILMSFIKTYNEKLKDNPKLKNEIITLELVENSETWQVKDGWKEAHYAYLDEIEKIEEETKKEEFKKNREEKASNKLKKGDKLSFDEFKILIEKGMI